jgi:hypothetical protein
MPVQSDDAGRREIQNKDGGEGESRHERPSADAAAEARHRTGDRQTTSQ